MDAEAICYRLLNDPATAKVPAVEAMVKALPGSLLVQPSVPQARMDFALSPER